MFGGGLLLVGHHRAFGRDAYSAGTCLPGSDPVVAALSNHASGSAQASFCALGFCDHGGDPKRRDRPRLRLSCLNLCPCCFVYGHLHPVGGPKTPPREGIRVAGRGSRLRHFGRWDGQASFSGEPALFRWRDPSVFDRGRLWGLAGLAPPSRQVLQLWGRPRKR